MRVGDTFLVSCEGKSDLCRLDALEDGAAVAAVIEESSRSTELPVKVYLFQGLPKGDKLELIIQKAVELGVHAVIPVEMSRSVVKIEEKKKKSKRDRWQAIAESAAKQSKRNIIPEISESIPFTNALEAAKKLDYLLLPYENAEGMRATKAALSKLSSVSSVGIFIGPEGGFDDKEIALATQAGACSVSLGRRILRTETAAIATLAACMLQIEINTD